jgi:hypothetical protein
MTSIADLAATVRTLLTTTAERMARETGFVQRRSKLTGAAFVQTLVLGWLSAPGGTLDDLTQTAATVGVDITPQGLDQRFTAAAADCLEGVLLEATNTVVAADPVAVPVLARFSAVYVEDSTTIALPPVLAERWAGCGGSTEQGRAALKLQVRQDLSTGAVDGLVLQDGRAADQASPLQTAPLPKQALVLKDLGYFSLAVLAQRAAEDTYWLTRLQVQAAVFDAAGERWDVGALLARQPGPTVDLPVQVGAQHRVAARLLAVRVPADVAATRRRKLHAQAREKGKAPSQARLALADWTILVTNAPAALLTVDEALVLARVRWQIELLFKLWKSHGQADESRSAQPERILCEVYAKVLAVLIAHWCVLVGCWQRPDRSLVKATRTVRRYGLSLAGAVAGALDLVAVLTLLQRTLKAGCRMNPRRKHPNTYQLLLALEPPTSADQREAA